MHGKLLIGILVLVTLLLVWGWFAGGARQQASFNRTDDRVKQAKTLLTGAFNGSRTERLAAIQSLTRLEQKNTCHGDWWNDWQQSVSPSIRTGAKECRAKEEKLAKVIQSADAIDIFLTDEAKITKQIGTLKIDSSAKDWPTRAKSAAESVVKALDGIRVVSAVQPVQQAAKSRTEAIISAWNALNTASGKQDKNSYLAAETQVGQSYADLAAVADVSDTALQTLLSALNTAAKVL